VRNQKEIAGKSRITKKFRKRARNDIDSPFSYGINNFRPLEILASLLFLNDR